MDERPISRAGVPGLAQNPMWNEAGMWLGINGLTSSAPIADWSVGEHLYGAPVWRSRPKAKAGRSQTRESGRAVKALPYNCFGRERIDGDGNSPGIDLPSLGFGVCSGASRYSGRLPGP